MGHYSTLSLALNLVTCVSVRLVWKRHGIEGDLMTEEEEVI